MTEIKRFNHSEFGELRAIEIDSEPWFIGKEVAEKLGYKNTRDALLNHVDKEDKNTVAIHDGIGNPNKVIINESGVYSLVIGSKLESAKRFKRWVTSEVLPTIRKTGGYVNNDDLFIDTYLPFADDITKLLFKNTLNVINNQNKLISEQKNEIRRKLDVIQGFAEDIPNPTKRKILNEVVRYGGNYKERWNCLYKEFTAVYGIDVSIRYKNYVEKGIKPKMVSKLDYVEKQLQMLDELYGLAVKLYESDINKIKERYDILSERN